VPAFLALAGCSTYENPAQRHADANTPAGKVGQAAHKLVYQADKAGKVIGRKLDKAAHDAHEGWNEASAKQRQSK
jgi:hypothetical protein